MTPEEQAVIDEALRWHRERRTGRDLHAACARLLEAQTEEKPQWIPRHWIDVRPGDTVRLPGTEHIAVIEGAVRTPWHVHPDADPWHPELSQVEWTAMTVTFRGETKPRAMNPAKPVEILLAPAEVAAIEAIGWSHRIGLEISS
jgi:hypothetical protein